MSVTCPVCGGTFDGEASTVCPTCASEPHQPTYVAAAADTGDPSSARNAVEETHDGQAEGHEPTVVPVDPSAFTRTHVGGGSGDGTAVDGGGPVVGGTFGDYELLGEIARGGMGVVFRARQTKLNRFVALKMILSSHLATEEDVVRFHAEAEAAAKLDHPGIVPVHEVGEVDGQHFFSMGLVEGGSLKDLVKGGPLPNRRAAEVVRQIAEAVHYAHTRNIVHRDLKPANVLLDAEGQPKVTDFGLAKDIEADTGMTTSGQIMGTPGYMPPEQASGRTAEIGPLADVYSLGGVLYFLLTREPPFRGEGVMETLRNVIDEEPTSPQAWNAGVDTDLATICLKCLEKDPARRYASAAELAEELGRYVEGRPILARPVSGAERFRRWCLRNPLVAGLAASSLVLLVAGVCASTYFAVEANYRAGRETIEKERAEKNFDAAERQRVAAENARKAAETATRVANDERDRAKAALAETRRTINGYVNTVRNAELLKEERFKPLLDELLSDAIAHYERYIEEYGDDPDNRAEVARTYLELATAVGTEIDVAGTESLERARERYRSLLEENPDERESVLGFCEASSRLGTAYMSGQDEDEARATFDEALALLAGQAADAAPLDVAMAEAKAGLLAKRVTLLPQEQQREALQSTVAIYERCVAAEPEKLDHRLRLYETKRHLLTTVALVDEDDETASEMCDAVIADVEARLEQDDQRPELRLQMAMSLHLRGHMSSRLQDNQEALAFIDRAITYGTGLVEEFPTNRQYRLELAICHFDVTPILYQLQLFEQGWQHVLESERHFSWLIENSPKDTYDGLFMKVCINGSNIGARLLQAQQRAGHVDPTFLAELLEHHTLGIPIVESAMEYPHWQRFQQSFDIWWKQAAGSAHVLGELHPRRLAFLEARNAKEMAELREKGDAGDADALVELANLHIAVARVDRALETLEEAVEKGWSRPVVPEGPATERGDASDSVLMMLLARHLGEEEVARAWRGRVVPFLELRNRGGLLSHPLLLAATDSDLERSPDDEALHVVRARVLGRMGEVEDALAVIAGVVERGGKSDDQRRQLQAEVALSIVDLPQQDRLYTKLILADPSYLRWRGERGKVRAMQLRYTEAMDDFALASLSTRDRNDRVKFLLLQAMAGLTKSYRSGCARFVDEITEQRKTGLEVEVVRLCLVADSGVPLQKLRALIERPDVTRDGLARRLLLYREGKYEELVAEPDDLQSHHQCTDRFCRALALWKLDRRDEARAMFDKAERVFSVFSPRESAWWDYVMCSMMRKEAAALLQPEDAQ